MQRQRRLCPVSPLPGSAPERRQHSAETPPPPALLCRRAPASPVPSASPEHCWLCRQSHRSKHCGGHQQVPRSPAKEPRPGARGCPQLCAPHPESRAQRVAVPRRRDPFRAGGWQLRSASPGSPEPLAPGNRGGAQRARKATPCAGGATEKGAASAVTLAAAGARLPTGTDTAASFLVRSQRWHGAGNGGRTGPLRTSAHIRQTTAKAPVAGGSSAPKRFSKTEQSRTEFFFKVLCLFCWVFSSSFPPLPLETRGSQN